MIVDIPSTVVAGMPWHARLAVIHVLTDASIGVEDRVLTLKVLQQTSPGTDKCASPVDGVAAGAVGSAWATAGSSGCSVSLSSAVYDEPPSLRKSFSWESRFADTAASTSVSVISMPRSNRDSARRRAVYNSWAT